MILHLFLVENFEKLIGGEEVKKNLIILTVLVLLLTLVPDGMFYSTASSAGTTIPSAAWKKEVGSASYVDGAPIGGFGAGTITWKFDGSFTKGRLDIGSNELSSDADCAFYMYQKPSGQNISMKKLDAGSIGAGQATYYSLFPKSWVDYSGSNFYCKAKVTQFSPIIPGNYETTSYPVGVYKWEITNPGSSSCDVAIMLSWKNEFGGSFAEGQTSGNSKGIILRRNGTSNATMENQGEFSLAAEQKDGVKVTYGSASGTSTLSSDFGTDGLLGDTVGSNNIGAVAFKATLEPGQTITVPVALSWDIPISQAGSGSKWYRKYTRFYGRSGLNSWKIAKDAIDNYSSWESSIDSWQNSVLNDTKYPQWLKTTMFNELYYYFTGGTYWEAGAASGQKDNPDEDMFSHLECYKYDFYGTSDVRFYGSWPLILMWPDIDKQAVRQFADSVYHTRTDKPAAIGTTAHDIGNANNVFETWNAYVYRDSTNWKDLNSKLVLMVYRDWALTGKTDMDFLKYCWIPVQKAMDKVKSQDSDGDYLPNSSGIDQTYDDMQLQGNTAYCGGLFVAACNAAKEIATAMGDSTKATQYQSWYEKSKENYIAKLWNGSYFKIDTGSYDTSRIMSDQLCGHWYAKACGLEGIVPDEYAKKSYSKVYEFNNKKFDNGLHGFVNIMKADGNVDMSHAQTAEAWVGTSYGVIAGMIQEGLETEASQVGSNLADTVWKTNDMWFRTPEAWRQGVSEVRAPYYMRANCIWAVKHAYDIVYGPSPSPTPQKPTVIYGDVDNSGTPNSIDFGYMRKYLLGIINQFPGENGLEAADVDGSRSFNSIDFGFMRQYLLGTINVFPAQTKN